MQDKFALEYFKKNAILYEEKKLAQKKGILLES